MLGREREAIARHGQDLEGLFVRDPDGCACLRVAQAGACLRGDRELRAVGGVRERSDRPPGHATTGIAQRMNAIVGCGK